MEFWLTDNNQAERFQLPVSPAEFSISKGNQNQSVNINNVGEINLLGKPGLATIDIASFFPAHEYSFCNYTGFPDPYDCAKLIDSWRLSGKPIRFMVTDTDINMAMAIESFEYGERDGTRDVYFTLSLKEYRFLSVTTSVVASSMAVVTPATTRSVTKEIPNEYTVKAGDSLYMIAKKLTGNGSNYAAIAGKNGIKNPSLIYPGQKLVIS